MTDKKTESLPLHRFAPERSRKVADQIVNLPLEQKQWVSITRYKGTTEEVVIHNTLASARALEAEWLREALNNGEPRQDLEADGTLFDIWEYDHSTVNSTLLDWEPAGRWAESAE